MRAIDIHVPYARKNMYFDTLIVLYEKRTYQRLLTLSCFCWCLYRATLCTFKTRYVIWWKFMLGKHAFRYIVLYAKYIFVIFQRLMIMSCFNYVFAERLKWVQSYSDFIRQHFVTQTSNKCCAWFSACVKY